MSAHLELLEGAGARARRWLLAAALMVSMHAAAGAIAVINWPEEEASEEDAGAFLLELAPVAVAPPTEKLNLAIGVRAEEAAAAVAPTEEIKEKSEIEVPKVEEAPLAPEPEIVLQKQTPVEEIEDRGGRGGSAPRAKGHAAAVGGLAGDKRTTARRRAAGGEACRPQGRRFLQALRSGHELAEVAGLPSQQTQEVSARRPQERPRGRRQRIVHHRPLRQGDLFHPEKSSGSDLLDQEAIEVLNRASPFPSPPADVPQLTIHLSLPIQFRIKR